MDTNLYLAQKLYEMGDSIRAEEICLSILGQDKKAKEAYLLLAYICYDREDYHPSIAYLTEADSHNCTTAEHSYLAGLNHHACNDTLKARLSFEATIIADSHHGDAYRNLGIINQADGEVLEAASHFCRALDIDPSDRLSRINLLNALQVLDWNKIEKNAVYQDFHRHVLDSIQITDFGIKRYLPVVCAALLSSNYFRLATEYYSSERSDHTQPMEGQAWYLELINDSLFQHLLHSDVIPVIEIEQIVTEIRHRHLVLSVVIVIGTINGLI
jgi:tetratricopeptide (TPR) repeat protein